MSSRLLSHLLLAAIFLAGCPNRAVKEDEAASPPPAATADGASLLDVYDEIGGEFTLTDQRGESFRLADTHGKVRLLFFGYAMCPDVCPLTLSRVVQVRNLLGENAGELTTLFVSVDPERDTPAKLGDYLRHFSLGEAVALTGSVEEIDRVVDLFRATYEKEDAGSAAGYLISHTSYLFLLDRQGTVRGVFNQSVSPGDMAAAVRALLDD